jgi:hypothetical protein
LNLPSTSGNDRVQRGGKEGGKAELERLMQPQVYMSREKELTERHGKKVLLKEYFQKFFICTF